MQTWRTHLNLPRERIRWCTESSPELHTSLLSRFYSGKRLLLLRVVRDNIPLYSHITHRDFSVTVYWAISIGLFFAATCKTFSILFVGISQDHSHNTNSYINFHF